MDVSQSASSVYTDIERDSSFSLPRGLRVPPEVDKQRAAAYLDQLIIREPSDLLSHVQRINLYLDREASDRAYGALLDLFIVLRDKGSALRGRMLDQLHELLKIDHYHALHGRLDDGINPFTSVPMPNGSVLYRPDLDSAFNDEAHAVSFELAQEFHKHGWNDLAKTLLEELRTLEPGNPKITEALTGLSNS